MTPHQSSVSSRQSSAANDPSPVVVVGGGLSGLIASTLAATSGLPVVLLEKSAAVGGRASSKDKQGFIFNLGPHALYRGGYLRKTLGSWGLVMLGYALIVWFAVVYMAEHWMIDVVAGLGCAVVSYALVEGVAAAFGARRSAFGQAPSDSPNAKRRKANATTGAARGR